MRIPESELIINGDGSVFHLHVKPEVLADNVILVGDPGRVELFRGFFSKIENETASREFVSLTGIRNGEAVTVLSTGIGTDNIDIVATELDALANVDFKTREERPEHRTLNLLRIGTCGAIQPDIPLGSYIFSHISIGTDGLLNWYENRDKIALLDFEKAFVEHVHWNKQLPAPYFVRASQELIDRFKSDTVKGMTISAPGFYGPQGRVVRQALAMPDMLADYESFSFGGYKITNFEMESSALAGMAAKLGHNAGTICLVIANRHLKAADVDYKTKMKDLVELAITKFTD